LGMVIKLPAHMEKKRLDFLAVGDITTDAFIRLKDAHIHCKIDSDSCELCVRFGDKIPYEFVEIVRAVGNSPNAAVCAARLGLKSGLATNLGDDENGQECLGALQREGVVTDYVSIHKKKETNYHYVLWFDADRTILVKHHEYSYHLPEISPPPRFVYLSSIGAGTEKYHDEITRWLLENPEIRLAFQPGTFQMKLGRERLKPLYERAEIFVCNMEEARRILNAKEAGPKELLKSLRALGPRLVIITDGVKGSYFSNGRLELFMPTYPDPEPPYERTGAGDAFAATFTACLSLGITPEEALRRAPINSMSVVQFIGAQRGLLSREKIEELLKKAPADYRPRPL